MPQKKVVKVSINNTNDVPTFIHITTKHMFDLLKECNRQNKGTIFNKKDLSQHDEESNNNLIARQEYEIINSVIAILKNAAKNKNKPRTPRSLQTMILKEKERSLNEDGGYGQYFSFILNSLNTELLEKSGIGLLPTPEPINKQEQKIKIAILPELKELVLIDKKLPQDIDPEVIVEKVLIKHKNLAERKLIIQAIKKLIK